MGTERTVDEDRAAAPDAGTDPEAADAEVGPGSGAAGAGPGASDGGDGMRRVDPASVTVIRITAIGWILGISTINAVGLVIARAAGVEEGWLPLALLILPAVAGAATAFAWWWPAVRWRHLRYRVDTTGFHMHHGVLWRSELSVPVTRVQHTDVSQGPVQRAFSLATLVVHTAGTANSSVSLGGLRHEVALEVRDHLVSESDDDTV